MRKCVIISVLMIGLAGCQTTGGGVSQAPGEPGRKETIGTLSGAVVGGALANQMAEGSDNQQFATFLGAVAGMVIGADIGASLDELDRRMMNNNYQTALETSPTNTAVAWKNPDSGNSGSVKPTRTFYRADTVCREYTQEIIVGGRKQQGYGQACRSADGDWQIVK
ncbi:glycine zipper 2TM domain-containing protein [Rhodobacteraceae bacterium IMCC1335]